MSPLRLIAAALFLVAAGAAPAGATTLQIDGADRSFEMYVPATAPRPLPVVLVLHGGGSTSTQIRRYTGFDRIARRENFLVVYPQALGGHWNDGRPEIAEFDKKAAKTNDVAFLLAIVDLLADRGLADPKRVYAAGLASGGMMVLRLACQASDRLAGAAVVSANQPEEVPCQPAHPVPMLFFHGTKDRFVPYGGGDILQWANIDRGRVLSADDTVGEWAKVDKCSGPAVVAPISDGSGEAKVAVDKVTFTACGDAPVERFISKGGGHAWPGAKQSRAGNALLGPSATAIDATEEIWAFFKAQPPL